MKRIHKLSASSDVHTALHHPRPDTIYMVLNTNERRDTLNLLKNKLFKE